MKSLLPPSATKPQMEMKLLPKGLSFQNLIANHLELSTILLIGGLVQGALLLLVPRFWVLLPAIFVLLGRIGRTWAITYKLIPNPYMRDAILSRVTAVLPDTEGEFNNENHATHEKVAVLILGARLNHPMGFLEAGSRALAKFNARMMDDLDENAPDNGFLGQTSYSGRAPNGANEAILISYWRSTDDILKFAYGPSHMATWKWWEEHAGDMKHMGISHETYEVDRGMYENVFLNFQPSRIGMTSFFRQGDKMIGGNVDDAWISPLVDASRGKFRTAKGRMGWTSDNEKRSFV